MHGPAKIWVHWYGEDGKPTGSPELLTVEEYAVRAGLSVRQARRQAWEQRRDRIAAIRELHTKDQNVAGGLDTAHKKQMEAIQKDQAAKQHEAVEEAFAAIEKLTAADLNIDNERDEQV